MRSTEIIRDKTIVNKKKPCDNCGNMVLPDEWFVLCLRHLVRIHPECFYGSLGNIHHKKCKGIDKNREGLR